MRIRFSLGEIVVILMIIKKIVTLLILIMFITAITLLALTATSDTITVTFDPQWIIDLDVWPKTANYSTVTFSSSSNWPIEGASNTIYYIREASLPSNI